MERLTVQLLGFLHDPVMCGVCLPDLYCVAGWCMCPRYISAGMSLCLRCLCFFEWLVVVLCCRSWELQQWV